MNLSSIPSHIRVSAASSPESAKLFSYFFLTFLKVTAPVYLLYKVTMENNFQKVCLLGLSIILLLPALPPLLLTPRVLSIFLLLPLAPFKCVATSPPLPSRFLLLLFSLALDLERVLYTHIHKCMCICTYTHVCVHVCMCICI